MQITNFILIYNFNKSQKSFTNLVNYSTNWNVMQFKLILSTL